MQLAANLTYLFTELPMLSRFHAAREAGFAGVEIPFPYDLSAKDLARAAKRAGLVFVAMATPAPNWSGGPRGFAAVPGNEARFRKDFQRMQEIAEILQVQHVNIMPGKAQGSAARQTLVNNLHWATTKAPGLSLLLEPVASDFLPGAFLDDLDLAIDVITEAGTANLGLQFDAFHLHHMTGDLLAACRKAAPYLRHIQIAGYPTRNEPDISEHYPELLKELAAIDYKGWISAEYAPAKQTSEGLDWMRDLVTG